MSRFVQIVVCVIAPWYLVTTLARSVASSGVGRFGVRSSALS
jgi:hypothetical protein